MQVEGVSILRWFLEVNTQPEVGDEAYDKGAEMLYEFFERELAKYTQRSRSQQARPRNCPMLPRPRYRRRLRKAVARAISPLQGLAAPLRFRAFTLH